MPNIGDTTSADYMIGDSLMFERICWCSVRIIFTTVKGLSLNYWIIEVLIYSVMHPILSPSGF